MALQRCEVVFVNLQPFTLVDHKCIVKLNAVLHYGVAISEVLRDLLYLSKNFKNLRRVKKTPWKTRYAPKTFVEPHGLCRDTVLDNTVVGSEFGLNVGNAERSGTPNLIDRAALWGSSSGPLNIDRVRTKVPRCKLPQPHPRPARPFQFEHV